MSYKIENINIGDEVKYYWQMFTSGTECNPKMMETGKVVGIYGDYVKVEYEGFCFTTYKSLGMRITDVHISRIVGVFKSGNDPRIPQKIN